MKNFQQKNRSLNQTPGFSLVETLVAISILLTVTSGIMLLVNQSIDSSERLSNRLTASYLASDVIEYLRYERDTRWLLDINNNDFDDWVDGASLDKCQGIDNYCEVDTRVSDGIVQQCSSTGRSDCDRLEYDPTTKRFGHDISGAETSDFRRTMKIKGVNDLGSGSDNEDEIIVEVVVSWTNQAGNTSDLVLTDTLTAWGD